MEKLKRIMSRFALISTCEFVAAALFTTVLYRIDSVTPMLLWQILLVALLCAVSTLIFPDAAISTRKAIMLSVIHYFIILSIVLGFGRLFEWFHFTSARSVIYMVSSITIIYVYVSVISWKKSTAEARRMNESLRKYQSRERK